MKITAIYSALAAMTVTAAGKTPAVYSLATIGAINAAQLPARLLIPFGDGGANQQSITLTSQSGDAEIVWRVADVCLWEEFGQGRGLYDVLPVMMAYAESYMAAIQAARDIAPGCVIKSATVTPKPQTYQNTGYWAIVSELTITEYAPKG